MLIAFSADLLQALDGAMDRARDGDAVRVLILKVPDGRSWRALTRQLQSQAST